LKPAILEVPESQEIRFKILLNGKPINPVCNKNGIKRFLLFPGKKYKAEMQKRKKKIIP